MKNNPPSHKASARRGKTILFIIFSVFICTGFLYASHQVNAQVDPGWASRTAPKVAPTTETTEGPLSGFFQECDEDSNLAWYASAGAVITDGIKWIGKGPAILVTALAGETMTIATWPITSGGGTGTGSSNAAAKAFQAGWISTRDLANMLIVLGFVIIGIATSLRLRDYEAKKLLLPLIVVAVLINFSGLLCGLIIDASNLTMNGLGGQSASMGTKFMRDMHESENKILCAALAGNRPGEYTATSIGFGFIYLAIAISFLYLSIALLARYAVLGILFVLSPLAFALYAFPFPKARGMFEKWWENFLKWAFIGVGITFFLNIAKNVADKTPGLQDIGESNAMGILFYLAIVLAIMVVGIKISLGSGGAIGGAAMGLAKGVAGFAMGAVAGGALGAAKIADKYTGNRASSAGQAVRSWAGGKLEKIGLRQMGATSSANSKQVDDEAGLMAKEYTAAKAAAASGDKGGQARLDSIRRLAQDGRGAKGAAAMKVLADNKDLGDAFKNKDKKGIVIPDGQPGAGTDLSSMAQRLRYAEASGATGVREKAIKQDPNISITPAEIRKSVQKTSPTQAAEWDASAMTTQVASSLSPAQAKQIGEKGSPELVDKVKNIKYKPPGAGGRFVAQSPEYKAAKKAMQASGPVGSVERTRAENNFVGLQKHLASDNNFK